MHLSLPQKTDHMNLLGCHKSFHQTNDMFTELCEFQCDEESDGVMSDEFDDEELDDVVWYGAALYASSSFAPWDY